MWAQPYMRICAYGCAQLCMHVHDGPERKSEQALYLLQM